MTSLEYFNMNQNPVYNHTAALMQYAGCLTLHHYKYWRSSIKRDKMLVRLRVQSTKVYRQKNETVKSQNYPSTLDLLLSVNSPQPEAKRSHGTEDYRLSYCRVNKTLRPGVLKVATSW